jgi:hypothetical protein
MDFNKKDGWIEGMYGCSSCSSTTRSGDGRVEE